MTAFQSIALQPYAHADREVRETCHKDRLGRLLGGGVSRFATNMIRREDGALPMDWRHFLIPAKGVPNASGPVFGFNPTATRNGKPYGASQPFRLFATEAEREAAIEAYFVAMEKRARKNAAA